MIQSSVKTVRTQTVSDLLFECICEMLTESKECLGCYCWFCHDLLSDYMSNGYLLVWFKTKRKENPVLLEMVN